MIPALIQQQAASGTRSGWGDLNNFSNTFLLTYAALFPIVNPIGSAPIFLGLTGGDTIRQRPILSRRVAINSFLLLLGSVFIGSHVLVFFWH